MVSEFKTGECGWCGTGGLVYRDSGRCQDCDRDVYHCEVCKDDQHAHTKCRHLFEDRCGEWSGSGTGYAPDRRVQQGFFDLIDAMPASFVPDLRAAIRSGKFYTWLIAPMIGSGGLLELNGMDYLTGREYGRQIIDLGQGPQGDDESMADGYRWLASLYKRDTLWANRLTIKWIDEWQDRRAMLRLADDGCRLVV